jgi:hypothetical protein
VRADGFLDPATRQRAPAPHEGDTVIVLSTAADLAADSALRRPGWR